MNKQKHIICKTIEKKDRQDRLLIFLSGILATEWILGLLQAATGTLAGHFTDFTVTGILNRAWEYWNTQYPAVHSVIETWNNKFLDSGTAILAGLSATILIGILFFFLLKEERQGIIFLFSLPIAIVQMLLPNEKNYFVAVYFITLFTAYLIIEN